MSRAFIDPGRRNGRSVWVLVLVVAAVSACATIPPAEEPEPLEVSAATRAAYQRAIELMQAGHYGEAIEDFETIANGNDALSGPWINIAIAWRALDEPEKAREALEAALEREGNEGPAYNQLGLLHRHAGAFNEARAAYEAGIAREPDYTRLYRNLGILCDIYLQDVSCALNNFREYQKRMDEEDDEVQGWIAELEHRAQ